MLQMLWHLRLGHWDLSWNSPAGFTARLCRSRVWAHYYKEREALDYMLNPEDLAFVDGFVELPWCAGLGVEVNESLVLEENKQPRSWKNPVWAASGRIGRGVVRGLRRKDPDAQQTL